MYLWFLEKTKYYTFIFILKIKYSFKATSRQNVDFMIMKSYKSNLTEKKYSSTIQYKNEKKIGKNFLLILKYFYEYSKNQYCYTFISFHKSNI